MKALALFGTLAVAKLLAVAGRDLPASIWMPLALLWQDALVALLFAAADAALKKKPVLIWGLFWLITGYVAVNVALTRVLSSPLTWQMSQAAGGALADSIRHYLTPINFALMTAVLFSAAIFAMASRRLRPIPLRFQFGTLATVTLAGAFAARTVDCGGLHRNAIVAFVSSALPHV